MAWLKFSAVYWILRVSGKRFGGKNLRTRGGGGVLVFVVRRNAVSVCVIAFEELS